MIKKKILLFAVMGLISICSLGAYQLSPLNVTYDSRGADSAKVYTIVNDSDSPIAIEIVSQKRNVDLDGNEYTEEAPEYFSIQPAKMIIKPDSTQLVRVQYRGPAALPKELAFRIVSEQIPYSRGAQSQETGQMISFLFVYSTSAYVKPSRVVESISPSVARTDDGKLEVVIENTGSVHQMLNSIAVTLTGDDGSVYALTEEELQPLSGQNLLTDSKLRTIIDVPASLAGAEAITASVSYDFSYSA